MRIENGVSAERQNYLWKEQGRSEYVWPASRMVWQNIAKLTRIGNFLKRPINQVLVDATEAYAAAILPLLEGKSPTLSKQEREAIANGVLVWKDANELQKAGAIAAAKEAELSAKICELRHEVDVLRQTIHELRAF